MDRNEWQKHHGFSDEEMAEICTIKALFSGQIVAVRTKEEQAAHDAAVIRRNQAVLLQWMGGRR